MELHNHALAVDRKKAAATEERRYVSIEGALT